MSGIRRNLVSLLLSQVATFTLSIVTVTIVPTRLGPASFGAYAVAASFVAFFTQAATLGSGTFLVKQIARDPSDLGRYIFNAVTAKTVYGLAVAIVAVLGARMLRYPYEIRLLIEICAIVIVLSALTDVLAAGLQATQRVGRYAFWAAVQRYVSGAVVIALLLVHKGVVVYAVVMSTAAIIPLFAYVHHLWPDVKGHMQLEPRLWRVIFSGGLPFFLWTAILLVYGSIDILMLQKMTNTDTVGWYSLAYTWVGIPVFFPSLLVTAVFPTLSNRAARHSPDFSPTVNRALELAVLVGTPMAIGIALIAPNIMGLFRYPAEFHHAVLLIRILAIHIPIVAMDMILAIALAAMDRQKAWVLVGCVAAIFNPAVNLVAIPVTSHRYGNGAIGASIVTVATEIVMMIGAILLRPAGVLGRQTLSFLVRSLLASLAMIPTVLAVGNAPLPVKVVVGVMTFAGASYGLGLVSLRTARHSVLQLVKSVREREPLADLSTQVETR